MKSDEIKKGLKEIKSFIISEMKNVDSKWRKYGTKYDSQWIEILISDKSNAVEGAEIKLKNNSYGSLTYSIEDIGLSKIRFNWLMKFYVEKFIKNKEKMDKMERIVSNWNSFLDKNKSLNRNKKLEEILK